jgi:hypothetical protein
MVALSSAWLLAEVLRRFIAAVDDTIATGDAAAMVDLARVRVVVAADVRRLDTQLRDGMTDGELLLLRRGWFRRA